MVMKKGEIRDVANELSVTETYIWS